jgi:hypothetical protein
MSSTYSDRRLRVYEDCFNEYRAQYVNYKKHYLAANILNHAHSALSIYSTVAGSVLFVMIVYVFRSSDPGVLTPLSLLLSASIAATSFISVFVDWDEKSSTYYREGQRHQNLFKEFNHLVKIRMPDPDENDSDLEQRQLELVEKKNDLNMETPQLSQHWYRVLKFREDLDWTRPPLSEQR